MFKRLERAMPYATVPPGDPIFRYGIRSVRFARAPRQLASFTFIVFVVVQILVSGFWLWSVINTYTLYPGSWSAVTMSSESAMYPILICSIILANPMLDYLCLSASMHNLSAEIRSGRWALLQLTPLDKRQILASEHAVAQVRAWRLMVIGMCVRIWVIVLMVVHYTLVKFDDLTLLFAVFFFGHVIIFIREPLWRMRVVTAIGLAIAAQARLSAMAYPAAIGVTFLFTLVYWLLFYLVLLVSIVSGLAWFCGPLISLFLWWVVRGYYRRLEARAMSYATRHAFASD